MARCCVLDDTDGRLPDEVDQELQLLLAQGHVNAFHRGWVVGWVRGVSEALLEGSQEDQRPSRMVMTSDFDLPVVLAMYTAERT